MARPVLTLLAALCALLFLPTLAVAQTADPAPESAAATTPVAVSPARPPKIGLVLSGGGALGLAHIGVLKELERLGIRPDVIVGTSMGALVGGLYASGASAGEIESEVVTINWDRVFNAEPDRDGLTYRQKRNQADFPVRASVGLRDWAIKLPEGAVSDQNLTITLRGLVRTKAAVPTFDQLPIPFRAVATDIETGQAVVLDRGNLATAMRASMSVPGVFPPALVNNRLLVDGGMANNIPVNVARAMGAEVVIVVALQAPLLKKDDLNSAVAILGQTVSLLVLANEREQLATLTPADVLIRVDITDFSAVDFKKAPALIEAGVNAARVQEGRLVALANGGGLPRPVPPPRIDYVRLANDSRLADALVLDRLNYPVGKELDNAALSKGLEAVYALGAFERVDYDIETVGGRTGLVVRAQEKKAGPQVVRVGMTLANDFRGSNDFAVSFDYRISPLDRFGSEGRIEGVLGSDFRLSGSYFKLLDINQGWFVEPRLVVESRNVPLFSARGFKSGEYRVTSGIAQLMGGYQFGGVGEIRAGIERGIGRATVAEGTSPFPTLNLSVGQLFLQGGIDTFDNPYFPKKGVLAQLRLTTGQEWLAARENFTSLEGSAAYAIRLGDGVVTLQAAGGRTLDGVLPPENLFRLGGLTTLSGYQRDELIGEAYAAFRAQYRYRLNSNPLGLVAVPLYVGGSLEAGNMWALDQDFDIANLRAGGSVFVAADTVFGPTFLAYGRSEGNRQAVYLFIGRPF